MAEKPELKQIECKGRNGYFKFGGYYVFTLGGTKAIPEKTSYVDISSTRTGKAPPIVFTGDNALLVELFEGVLAKLYEGDPENPKRKILNMLERLTEKVERANSIKRRLSNEDWAELHRLTSESRAIIHSNK